jgi:hypothetical protein
MAFPTWLQTLSVASNKQTNILGVAAARTGLLGRIDQRHHRIKLTYKQENKHLRCGSHAGLLSRNDQKNGNETHQEAEVPL